MLGSPFNPHEPLGRVDVAPDRLNHSAPRRAICSRCQRPLRTCLCALVQPTAHRTDVLVLQHPHEAREAKNSVALLRLSLARCTAVVGERFAPDALHALLHPPGMAVRLLYPDVPAAPAPSATTAQALDPHTPLRLVVIDATWRKSLRMLLEHPILAALPRLSLNNPAPTRYRALRAARNPDQLSTLEATVQALAMIEASAFDGVPLLQSFGRFVDREMTRRAGRNASKRSASTAKDLVVPSR